MTQRQIVLAIRIGLPIVALLVIVAVVLVLRSGSPDVAMSPGGDSIVDQCVNGELYDEEFGVCYFPLSPSDCLPEETYEADTQTCVLECSSDAECAELEKQIAEKVGSLGDDFIDGDLRPEEDLDYNGQEELLVSYRVRDGALVEQKLGDSSSRFAELQTDSAKHEAVWNYFRSLFPAQHIALVSVVEFFSDGAGGTAAAVNPLSDDPRSWVLAIDLADAFPNGEIDKQAIAYVFIHEFGHLLTLNASQVTVDEAVLRSYYEAETDEEANQIIAEQESACGQFYVPEGCTTPESYLNAFFQQFWIPIYGELKEIEAIPSDSSYATALERFSRTYGDQFVTEYAATNPGEDIAETWAVFVLQDKPTGTSVADQKVNFFYSFPDLVTLRDTIRTRL